MSINSEQLNYLIWCYLQESGHELTSMALQKETRVANFEQDYLKSSEQHIPLGSLVNLVQKGVLYAHAEAVAKGTVPEDDTNSLNLVDLLIKEEKFDENSNENIKNDIDQKIAPTQSETTLELQIQKSFDQYVSTESAISKEGWLALACGKELVLTKKDKTDIVVPLSAPIVSLTWSPHISGKDSLISAGLSTGAVHIWRVVQDENDPTKYSIPLVQMLAVHEDPVASIKWSPDATYIATADLRGRVIIWESSTGTAKCHIKATNTAAQCINWAEESRLIVPLESGKIGVFDTTGSRIGFLNLKDNNSTSSPDNECIFASFNPNSKRLLTATDDNILRIWEGSSPSPSMELIDHKISSNLPIVNATWNKNGQNVISLALDGSVRIWSLSENSSSQCIGLALPTIKNGQDYAFCGSLSQDEKLYAVGTSNGCVYLYNIEKFFKRTDDAKYFPLFIDKESYNEEALATTSETVKCLTWFNSEERLVVSRNKTEIVEIIAQQA